MKTTFRLLAWILVWTVLPSLIHCSKVRAQEYVKSDFMVSDLTAIAEGIYYLKISGASFHSTQPLIILK